VVVSIFGCSCAISVGWIFDDEGKGPSVKSEKQFAFNLLSHLRATWYLRARYIIKKTLEELLQVPTMEETSLSPFKVTVPRIHVIGADPLSWVTNLFSFTNHNLTKKLPNKTVEAHKQAQCSV